MSLTQNDKLPHKASIIQYCDTQRNPIAVEQKPRLSWRIADVPDGYMQTAYRIRVASCREKLAEAVKTMFAGGSQVEAWREAERSHAAATHDARKNYERLWEIYREIAGR